MRRLQPQYYVPNGFSASEDSAILRLRSGWRPELLSKDADRRMETPGFSPESFISKIRLSSILFDKSKNQGYTSQKGNDMQACEIIRKLRKERKMTLLELSTRSGVALATLSRMENGKMTGTLESHMSVCKALEVSLPDLYRDLEASAKTVDVQTKKARTDVFVHDKRSSSEMLAPNVLNKKMMPTMIRMQKGGNTHKEETRPGVEKFAYVLEGKIEASIGDEKYVIGKGDTLYFDSSVPHYFKNTGSGEARMICVITPPAL